jgi:hypothetical protein
MSEEQNQSWSEEAVYDEKIAPLMSQIIAICKEHEIPMVATFQYATFDEGGPAYCTTTLPNGRASEHIRDMAHRIRPRRPIVALAETTVTHPDGRREISIRRVT